MTDTDEDLDGIAEVGRMLLRDVARIRGTLPPALAAVENFTMGWMTARPDQNWDPPPTEFYDAYEKWQASLPVAQRLENQLPHELDAPLERLCEDLDLWVGLVCMPPRRLPPPHLQEAVLIDILACYREICGETRDAIWRWRYPEADTAQWDKWFNDIHEFFHPPADR
jgi:hypothetical protein